LTEVGEPKRRRFRAILVLGFLLASLLGLQLLLPLGSAVKIGADEGFELSKATLCAQGYKLYTEIWNDQPPLTTSILTSLVLHVSPRILGPRLLSVSLALILLSSFFILVFRLNGVLVAGLATAMLLASPGFVELSSSCMQEVPALAPIIAALCVLVVLPSPRWHLGEIFAGALFGLGLQFKLIGIFYVPLAALIIWLQRPQRAETFKHTARSSTILIATAALVFVGLNGLTGNPLLLQLQQSWAAHFSSAKSFEYGSPADHPYDWTVLAKNWDTTIPALLGVLLLLLAMRRHPRQTPFTPHAPVAPKSDKGGSRFTHHASRVLPLAWLGLTLAVFGTHRPWWSYYYLHNSIPLCWCAAIGFAALARWIRVSGFGLLLAALARRRSGSLFGLRSSDFSGQMPCTAHLHPNRLRQVLVASLMVLFCLGAFCWMSARVYVQESSIHASARLDSCLVLKEIARFKPFTTFLFPYDPIYSFHADIPAPPHLAMISLKRLWSGELSTSRLVAEVESVKPGLIRKLSASSLE
jgi:hypothetical protein